MEEKFTYYAFISYSHIDVKWAHWIQKSLENYKLPNIVRNEISTLPEKIRPVFRDATDLGAGRLKENLYKELEESKYLIVVCSPSSANPNTEGKHWVNDEVETFIKMGRADKVIPVIIAGRPNSATTENECFPPEIKKMDILGIDASKMSKERVLNDLVAKILGLRPGILWDRHKRSDIKRRRLTTAIVSTVLIPLLIGAFFYWDYAREKIYYYADYVEKQGLPVGIFELTKAQTQKRNSHYIFISKRNKLQKVIHSNSYGTPILHRYDSEYLNRPMIQKMNYDNDGKLQSVDYLDNNDKLMVRNKFSGNNYTIVDFIKVNEKNEESAITLARNTTSREMFKQEDGKSNISRFKYERDGNGHIAKIQFRRDNRNLPVKDASGVFGFQYELDELGRIIAIWYIGESGQRTTNNTGVAGKNLKYHAEHLVRVEHVNDKGTPIFNVANWVTREYKIDNNGNVIEELYKGDKGKPSNTIFGYSIVRYIYDIYGNRINTSYYDSDGNQCLSIEGANVTLKYNERGNCTETAYFGIDGKPCINYYGYAKITNKYDERENITEEAYFGIDNKPCSQNGYAKITNKYDEHGSCTETAYFGIDGKPCINKDGCAKYTNKYDEPGHITETVYFGADGKPCNNKYGYAKVADKFDELGNIIETTYFGADGKLCFGKDRWTGRDNGYAKVAQKFDELGNITETVYFGIDGKPCNNKYGYAKVADKFDELGNIIETTYFGADGKLCFGKDRSGRDNGYAKITKKYDERGNISEIVYYGVDEKPCIVGDYAKMTRKYNERGQSTEMAYFGIDGKPCINQKGYAKITREYNELRQITQESYFGIDGKPCINQKGYAKIAYKCDEQRRVTEESYFGIDGKPCINQEGYAKITNKYDEQRRASEMAYFGIDGLLQKTNKYDKQGRTTEESYFGIDGKPCISQYGCAKITWKYDEQGQITETAFFGIDGKPCNTQYGGAKVTCKYNEQGQITEQSYFDVDGKPCIYQNGNAK